MLCGVALISISNAPFDKIGSRPNGVFLVSTQSGHIIIFIKLINLCQETVHVFFKTISQ